MRGYPKNVEWPVISIGNVVAGGAGKTPVTLYLCGLLKSKGYTPIVLTRGYGRLSKTTRKVTPHDVFQDAGDEPLEYASEGYHTWVSNNRFEAYKQARAYFAQPSRNNQEHYGDGEATHIFRPVIVLDDGHQQQQLHCCYRILVMHTQQGIQNGYSLPAGPLREPLAISVARADIVVLLHDDSSAQDTLQFSELKPQQCIDMHCNYAAPKIALQHSQRMLAFCGLGYPQKFFNSLKKYGKKHHLSFCGYIAFGDHAIYTKKAINKLMLNAQHTQAQSLITTRKDAMRLKHLLLSSYGHQQTFVLLNLPLYVFSVHVTCFEEKRFWQCLEPHL